MSEHQLKELPKKNREFLDPQHSEHGGLYGFAETVLRRFKNVVHFALIVPLASSICLSLGV